MLFTFKGNFSFSILLRITLLILWNYHTSGFQFFDIKSELTKHKISMTNIPRVSYKITKDPSSSFWIVNINLKEETQLIPMLLVPYVSTTWIYSDTTPVNNFEGIVCDASTACIQIIDDSDYITENYFNYSIAGDVAYLQVLPSSYTSFFFVGLVDTPPTINPPLTVSGGLGLGTYSDSESEDVTSYDSFLESFYNLENFVAGIYLSQDNINIDSELLIGDYNPSYINTGGYNTTIATDPDWSFTITSVNDDKGNLYVNPSGPFILDPNLNAIGIPLADYSTFLANFLPLGCSNTSSFPTCHCNNDSSDSAFPTLIFNSYNISSIVVPPELYVQKGQTCTLLIVSTDQMNVSANFNVSWVFGSPFMTYYYTVLNWTGSQSQVTFYQALPFDESAKFYLVISGLTAIVIIGGVVACLSIIQDKKQKLVEPEVADIEIMEQRFEDKSPSHFEESKLEEIE